MKSIRNIIIFAFSALLMLGCKKDKAIGSAEILGEWKLIEEFIGGPITPGISNDFEPIQSNKTITFYSNGTYLSNGETCSMTNQAGNSSEGFFYESSLSLEPEGCQSAAPTSDISYEIKGDILFIGYPCFCGCAQKYKRI